MQTLSTLGYEAILLPQLRRVIDGRGTGRFGARISPKTSIPDSESLCDGLRSCNVLDRFDHCTSSGVMRRGVLES